jgi:hypothetical protein
MPDASIRPIGSTHANQRSLPFRKGIKEKQSGNVPGL